MHLLASILTRAGGISISIGNYSFSFGTNIIVYLLVAAVIGVVAEFLVGWRLPFGIIGAIIAALIGIWLMTNVIHISGLPTLIVHTTPPVDLVQALIGALILVAIWHLITYPAYRSRRRYYYRR
jgi:uncharacterized membrane protein YeaQ/YmgE (transglycosylase-associated protein family)